MTSSVAYRAGKAIATTRGSDSSAVKTGAASELTPGTTPPLVSAQPSRRTTALMSAISSGLSWRPPSCDWARSTGPVSAAGR
jgi:hypothetical protein